MLNRSVFENKIKPVLEYVGGIGAVICMIAYVITVFVLINGFNPSNSTGAGLNVTIVFSIVTAAIGFIIMQLLKIQGISFAKGIPENEKVIKEYFEYKAKMKKKKDRVRSIKYFWMTTVVKDIIIKCMTFALSTISIVWIVIQGSKDYNLLLLALVNLLMFICFGLLSLSKAYDFYCNNHINFLKAKIEEYKKIQGVKDDNNREQRIEEPRRTSTQE